MTVRPQLRAAAVFKGGGAKGAALAGALSVARERVQIVAAGGSSAGALVALLTALRSKDPSDGYLRNALIELSEAQILGGEKQAQTLSRLRESVGAVAQRLSKVRGGFSAAWAFSRSWFAGDIEELKQQAANVAASLGLFSREGLESVVKKWVDDARGMLPGLPPNQDLTFDDLRRSTGVTIRVIASDLHRRQASVRQKNDRVLEWVPASAAFPIVFRPIRVGTSFTDGGLASNLPAFLFRDLLEEEGTPTFAFDLVSDAAPQPLAAEPSALEYFKSLVDTAMDAHELILLQHLEGCFHVPIVFPSQVSTLDFSMSAQTKNGLYNAGVASASRFFDGFPPLSLAGQSAKGVRDLLWRIWGGRELIETILDSMLDQLEYSFGVEGLRGTIMLETPRGIVGDGEGTRIVCYSSRVTEAEQSREMDLSEGVSGVAHTTGRPHMQNFAHGSPEAQAGIGSMASFPIRMPSGRVVATLNVDGKAASEAVFTPPVVDALNVWALVLGQLLSPWRQDVRQAPR